MTKGDLWANMPKGQKGDLAVFNRVFLKRDVLKIICIQYSIHIDRSESSVVLFVFQDKFTQLCTGRPLA